MSSGVVSGGSNNRWVATVYRAVATLVAVALGGRLAWILLRPMVPLLVTVLGLIAVFAVMRGWLRR
jgi:hypothetical protein